MSTLTLEEYQSKVGQEVGLSKWFELDQSKINVFADVTEDWQFIHVDEERAAKTPFGGTVAHGFLTLSMLAAMSYDALPSLEHRGMGVNYGFDKVRFMSPVRAGKKVRARFKLLEVSKRNDQEYQTRSEVTVEIEGQEKPALVAEWLGISYFTQPV